MSIPVGSVNLSCFVGYVCKVSPEKGNDMWEIQWDCELNIRRPYGAGSLWPWGTAGGTDDNPGCGPGAENGGFSHAGRMTFMMYLTH